jgi:hypothetical protein
VFLTASECDVMILNKTCKQSDNTYEKMTCDSTSNDCVYKSDNFITGFTECVLVMHNLKAFTKNERIMGKNCHALFRYFKLDSSVLVWSSDIITYIPLSYVVTRDIFVKIAYGVITHAGENAYRMEKIETFSDCNINGCFI